MFVMFEYDKLKDYLESRTIHVSSLYQSTYIVSDARKLTANTIDLISFLGKPVDGDEDLVKSALSQLTCPPVVDQGGVCREERESSAILLCISNHLGQLFV